MTPALRAQPGPSLTCINDGRRARVDVCAIKKPATKTVKVN